MGVIHSKPKTCNNFEYFMKPTNCKRYYEKVKGCSKRDRALFGQNCKKQGKLVDRVFTSAKSWPELWQQIKDFSLSDKISALERYLGGCALGAGSIIAEIIFPEITISRMSLEALDQIKNGKPPLKAIGAIGMALLMEYAIGNEVDVLEISEKSLYNKAIQDKLLKSKTGKKAIKFVSKNLPKNIREQIYQYYDITDDI